MAPLRRAPKIFEVAALKLGDVRFISLSSGVTLNALVWARILFRTLRWLFITPLGLPVVPEV